MILEMSDDKKPRTEAHRLRFIPTLLLLTEIQGSLHVSLVLRTHQLMHYVFVVKKTEIL